MVAPLNSTQKAEKTTRTWTDRRVKECIARHVYAKIAFPLLRRLLRVDPLIVYYHVVSDHKIPHLSNLYKFRNVSQFNDDLTVLQRFFQPLALQDFLAAFEGTHSKPDSFMLTFDDGLSQCYEIIAPILNSKGIPAIFFLCSAFVDNKELAYDHKKSLLSAIVGQGELSSSQKKEVGTLLNGVGLIEEDLVQGLMAVDYSRRQVLDRIAVILDFDFAAYLKTAQPYLTSERIIALLKMGHAIGAHSIDHPRYADLSLEEQIRQTCESVRFIKERFALNYGAFSFPHSDANVSKEFFERVFGDNEIDVCFGNQGLMEDAIPRNLQRSTMEKTSLPAEAILGRAYLRRYVKKLSGKLVFARP